jgi:hypothetical protein
LYTFDVGLPKEASVDVEYNQLKMLLDAMSVTGGAIQFSCPTYCSRGRGSRRKKEATEWRC